MNSTSSGVEFHCTWQYMAIGEAEYNAMNLQIWRFKSFRSCRLQVIASSHCIAGCPPHPPRKLINVTMRNKNIQKSVSSVDNIDFQSCLKLQICYRYKFEHIWFWSWLWSLTIMDMWFRKAHLLQQGLKIHSNTAKHPGTGSCKIPGNNLEKVPIIGIFCW